MGCSSRISSPLNIFQSECLVQILVALSRRSVRSQGPSTVIIITLPVGVIKIADHYPSACGGMCKFVIADIDAHVRNVLATNLEEHKVARLKITFAYFVNVRINIS